MKIYDQLVALKNMVNSDELLQDVTKTDNGQGAAGTRVRVRMQDIKSKCQDIRVAVLETRAAKA